MFVSVTRLRLRSLRFLPGFAKHASRSRRQALAASGCHGVEVRRTRGLAFWTLTVWDSEQSMKDFALTDAHREAIPSLAHWCDEAAIAHWEQASMELPGWDTAAEKLVGNGRLSRVLHPSERQSRREISTS